MMTDDTKPADHAPEAAPLARDHADGASGGRLLLGWALVILAVVLLFGGWLGVSRNPEVARQLAYFVSGGLGGMLAGIVGVGLLISDDVRRDRARLGRLEATVLELHQIVSAQAEALHRMATPRNGTAREARPAARSARKQSRG